ncbi:MAG: cytidylate kinase-like family protein [Candidatus Solibacter sp.]|nr:cytidylate kinase-like family protein [Candidatus Solibacter sp.]
MKYRALTIAREYGSGGAEIAGSVASSLGWRLVDKVLLTEISSRAKVPVADVVVLDEQVDPWLHRLTRPLWGTGGDGISAIIPVDLFDADAEAALAKQIIQEAYWQGNCVIVGRGAQCVLQAKPDVFHALVYARRADRVHRLLARVAPGTDVCELLHTIDEQRHDYVHRHYGENRLDPHLYDLAINCHNQVQAAARLILLAMESAG